MTPRYRHEVHVYDGTPDRFCAWLDAMSDEHGLEYLGSAPACTWIPITRGDGTPYQRAEAFLFRRAVAPADAKTHEDAVEWEERRRAMEGKR